MTPALELWQAEWSPSSHRVRQRLTELGLTFMAHRVPARREGRGELIGVTGHNTIPVLRVGDDIVAGSGAIIRYLDHRYPEREGAAGHRRSAAEVEQQQDEDVQVPPNGEWANACAVQ